MSLAEARCGQVCPERAFRFLSFGSGQDKCLILRMDTLGKRPVLVLGLEDIDLVAASTRIEG